MARRHRLRVPRRGLRGRQGPGRGRCRARRPGRADLPDPLRVDAVRLRDLVRRRRRRCRSTRRRRPSRSSGSCATPGPPPSSPRAPTTWPGSPRLARRPRRPPPRVDHRHQRGRHPHQPRRRHLRRRPREAADGGPAGRPRHAHLHLGHDRAAQGLHADARQLPHRAGRRRPRARRPVPPTARRRRGRGRRTPSTLLFLPLAHVFARIIQIGAIRRGSGWGTAPT